MLLTPFAASYYTWIVSGFESLFFNGMTDKFLGVFFVGVFVCLVFLFFFFFSRADLHFSSASKGDVLVLLPLDRGRSNSGRCIAEGKSENLLMNTLIRCRKTM